jgi:type IV fimbrial biogenesis protein FimT
VDNNHLQRFPTNKTAGFTLMEILVLLVVIGIMMSIAAPGFANFIANGRISSASNDLLSDLRLARSIASTNGRRAVVCASTNGTSCSSTVGDWRVGRIVFIDKNANAVFDAGETLVKYTTGLPSNSNSNITMNGFPSSYIVFNSYGGMIPLGTGQFKLCVTNANQCRQISIDYSGRASVTKVP